MNDRHEEDLLGRLLRESATERAPDRFSQGVMDRILAGEASLVKTPPLIPRWGWGLIAASMAALTAWGWFAGRADGAGLLPEGAWNNWLDAARLPGWELPSVPPSLAYGAVALAVFTLLQVFWMRRRLEQQWSL